MKLVLNEDAITFWVMVLYLEFKADTHKKITKREDINVSE